MDFDMKLMVDVGVSESRSKKLLLKPRDPASPPIGRLLKELEMELENDPGIEPASPPMLLLKGSTLFRSNVF